MTQLEEIIHRECAVIGTAPSVLAKLTDAPRPLNGDATSCWAQAMPGVAEPSTGNVAAAIANVNAFRDSQAFIEDLEHNILPTARRNATSKGSLKSQIASR